jgi:hypothetical protein
VRNAPFSAEAVSESIQVLADGNKLTRKETTRMYRDSEGRFRREQIPNLGGSIGTVIGMQQTISIFDPVAGVQFLLNPTAKTARRSVVRTANSEGKITLNTQQKAQPVNSLKKETKETNVFTFERRVGRLPNPIFSSDTSKTESLGMREIEGVKAEGTRSISTIPAGTFGNERAFDIVYERWFSEELQQIILSKHSDPRFGVQTYRLINIKRNEPDRTLFQAPAEYQILNSTSQ